MSFFGVDRTVVDTALQLYPYLESLPKQIQSLADDMHKEDVGGFVQAKAVQRVDTVATALFNQFHVRVDQLGVVADTEDKLQRYSSRLCNSSNTSHAINAAYSNEEILAIIRELTAKNPAPTGLLGWCWYYVNTLEF